MRVAFLLLLAPVVSALNFLALGDWGGNDDEPYYTTGQMEAAAGMDKVAAAMGSEFVLALGDNFYMEGIRAGENDPRFQSTFENVYKGDNLQKSWYVLPGNHDYKGNVSAQIAYSLHSNRWKFPSRYYKLAFTGADGVTVDILMLDTVELGSLSMKAVDEEGYFDPLPLQPRRRASEQWDWIEAQMASSTADFLLVAGHYPVYSICKQGITLTLVEYLRPLLMQYDAQYLSGHDHCMEHLIEVKQPTVNYIVSGMGKSCCYDSSRMFLAPKGSLQWYIADDNKGDVHSGFTSFDITKGGMNVLFHDHNGEVIHSAPTIAPRKL